MNGTWLVISCNQGLRRFKNFITFLILMNWEETVYAVVIVLLYLPLVFLGANVLFDNDLIYPEYPCARPVDPAQIDTACQADFEDDLATYNEARRDSAAKKYVFVVLLNLGALLVSLAPLRSSISYGLFVGSTLATFFGTWIYFEAKSVVGFVVLLVIFAITLVFIQKRKGKKKGRK